MPRRRLLRTMHEGRGGIDPTAFDVGDRGPRAACRAARREPALSRADQNEPLSIRITSPLGRTGVAGVVRIVAQVHAPPGAALNRVRFFVDNVLLGEVADGPPWAVEWADENPFEPREIAAEVERRARPQGARRRAAEAVRGGGEAPRSRASLARGLGAGPVRAVRHRHPARRFTVLEDGVPQTLDLVRPETLPATYTLLVDSSQSMAGASTSSATRRRRSPATSVRRTGSSSRRSRRRSGR